MQLLAPAPGGFRLRRFHGIENGVEHVQRDHHHDSRARIGALQFPCHGLGELLNGSGAGRGVKAIGLYILLVRDGVKRVGIGISIGDVGTLGGIGIGKYDRRADFLRGANGFDEGIGGLYGNVDRGVVAGL